MINKNLRGTKASENFGFLFGFRGLGHEMDWNLVDMHGLGQN
jgi:hypothetical protein